MTDLDALRTFAWGALTMACLVAGLYFLRFWRDTRDRLFLFFAAAFWVFSLSWIALVVFQPGDDSRHYAFLFRLGAFLLIIIGIYDKNRARPP